MPHGRPHPEAVRQRSSRDTWRAVSSGALDPDEGPLGNCDLRHGAIGIGLSVTLPFRGAIRQQPGAKWLLSDVSAVPQAGVQFMPPKPIRKWQLLTPSVAGLEVLDLPRPKHLVTAESVDNGKPDPTCYLMGLDKLGHRSNASNVLVLEDSPAGIRAGKAAGCSVLGLVTSHSAEQVMAAGPDWIVRDLTSVKVVGSKGGAVTLEISQALAPTHQ